MNFFFRYLLRGSDVQYLDRSWLANKERLAMYEQWTLNERESAYVSKGVDHFRRQEFWAAIEAKAQPKPRPRNVREFLRESQR